MNTEKRRSTNTKHDKSDGGTGTRRQNRGRKRKTGDPGNKKNTRNINKIKTGTKLNNY